ncbi:MAG: hypothetical protein EKK53_21425 [Burkholderiales bacterium]|nr:MAG: hypothetical protein EKK53_21425 [Burkholderiales bacterium]
MTIIHFSNVIVPGDKPLCNERAPSYHTKTKAIAVRRVEGGQVHMECLACGAQFGRANIPTKLFRYEDRYGVVTLEEYPVVGLTPCGVYINRSHWKKPKWVQLGTRKKFAAVTIEEAKKSFLQRKKHQLAHLESQAENVRIAVKAMTEGRLNDSSHIPDYY